MQTIDDLDVAGRRVLVRADFNVPLEDAGDGTRRITDDGRIRAALPTIESLRERGARVILAAHLGRPKGEAKPELSLAPVAARLSELLGVPVDLATDVTGPSAHAVVAALGDGDVALLENVRYDRREDSKDDAERAELAAEFAELADLFVSDGFGVVHRKQASVSDVATLLPHAAGRLVLSEVDVFRKVLSDPDRPYAVILGGSKVSDKLGVITNLLHNVDRLLVGGGMCFTFLAALGKNVGSSLLEADQIETVQGLIRQAEANGVELVLPVDVIVATAFSADAEHKDVSVDDIEDGWMGLDIGPNSRILFADRIADATTVVWNGPMGVFEMAPYAEGTRAVAEAITRVDGLTVVGGGDSAAAVRLLGIDESGFSHLSTGGGASLEFLEGRTLPGIAVLED
jgi:phosphoglycerate kinase